MPVPPTRPRPLLATGLTAAAVTAFAANSVLCRVALQDDGMDPGGFTVVRMTSAALVLGLLMRLRRGDHAALRAGSWRSAGWLFGYAILFSLAYVELEAGTGALLLFGAVQVTMIGIGLARGERPTPREWLGFALALTGLLWLLWPGVHAPAAVPATSMVGAGVAWGLYSLRGRGTADPAATTCGNFVRTLPLVGLLAVVAASRLHATPAGLLAALASGALASGLGYVLWYAALRYLTATRAAIVQLLSPILATLGGAGLLGEAITPRLVLAALAGFTGVILATTARRRR